MKRICWMAIGGLLISLCAAAQDNAAMEKAKRDLAAAEAARDYAAMDQAKKALTTAMQGAMQNVAVQAKIIGPEKMVLTSPVTGAPYSADEVTTFTQTLADGTRIQREDKVTVYRDGQGRIRRETPGEIMISDPVSGTAYSLDPNNPTARKVMVMRREASYSPRPTGAQQDEKAAAAAKMTAEIAVTTAKLDAERAAAGAKTFTFTAAQGSDPGTFVFVNGGTVVTLNSANSQSLGTLSIEGVLSEGTSTTETIPAGTIGNDRPIQVVNERWYSPELQTVTMTKHSDPRTGEEVFRLTNVRRGEPSPDLFQAPAGCQAIGPCPAKE